MKNENYLKQFKYFTIFEYEKEEKYLREMHKSGWRFIKVTGFGKYHFEKCTPEIFSVNDIFEGGINIEFN